MKSWYKFASSGSVDRPLTERETIFNDTLKPLVDQRAMTCIIWNRSVKTAWNAVKEEWLATGLEDPIVKQLKAFYEDCDDKMTKNFLQHLIKSGDTEWCGVAWKKTERPPPRRTTAKKQQRFENQQEDLERRYTLVGDYLSKKVILTPEDFKFLHEADEVKEIMRLAACRNFIDADSRWHEYSRSLAARLRIAPECSDSSLEAAAAPVIGDEVEQSASCLEDAYTVFDASQPDSEAATPPSTLSQSSADVIDEVVVIGDDDDDDDDDEQDFVATAKEIVTNYELHERLLGDTQPWNSTHSAQTPQVQNNSSASSLVPPPPPPFPPSPPVLPQIGATAIAAQTSKAPPPPPPPPHPRPVITAPSVMPAVAPGDQLAAKNVAAFHKDLQDCFIPPLASPPPRITPPWRAWREVAACATRALSPAHSGQVPMPVSGRCSPPFHVATPQKRSSNLMEALQESPDKRLRQHA